MKAKINITYRDENQKIITDPEEGQRGYSPETGQLYEYRNGKWELLKANGGLSMSCYDINKQIIAQLENIENNEEKMQEAKDIIKKYTDCDRTTYYMLLCKDINYYTVFHVDPLFKEDYNTIVDEVIDCLHYIGAIKSVSLNNSGEGIEIWVHPVDSDPMVMYLFLYNNGVIQCTN